MLRTDYSRFYPIRGSALNRTNEAVNELEEGGGGGGAVSSVNNKTGAVVITLDDVVGDMGMVDGGVLAVVDDATAPNAVTMVQATEVSVTNATANKSATVGAGEVYVKNGNNRAKIVAPASGGLETSVTLPSASGTLALKSDIVVPAPPTTGSYTLQSVNGVVSWIEAA